VKQILPLFVVSVLVGCGSTALTGTFTLDAQGPDLPDILAAGVVVNWDEEVNWTREVVCATGGGLKNTSYEVRVYDRSVGAGLEVTLSIQAYEGPGGYDRDEFQPTPVLTVDFDQDVEDEGDDDDSAADEEDPEDGEEPEDDEEGEDDDSTRSWHFGTDSGGECGISVDEEGTSGAFACSNIPVHVDFEQTGGQVRFSGSWTCSDLDAVDKPTDSMLWNDRF
jgi:hypothetical protein